MASDLVASFLRNERTRICEAWEAEVRRDRPALGHLDRPALFEHLFEFLEGLADWIEGNADRAERAFAALIDGHALQRLGYGVGLETLPREYSKLRVVLLRELLAVPSTDEVRHSMIRLHEGMDRAISDALRRYAIQREEVRERFISILGHDLRDPMSTVLISANVLAQNATLPREDPFSRGDPTDPRQGLGLGLYIVQQIAAAHGATCNVSSSDAATIFTIRWPRSPGAARRAAAVG